MRIKEMSSARRFLRRLRGRRLSFGRMLEALRRCDGIAQATLAERMQLSRAYVCDVEKGRRLVSPEWAARFARVLGYSVNQFVAIALEDQLGKAGLKLHVHLKAA